MAIASRIMGTGHYLLEKVGVPEDKVFVNVEEYGNMASACLPIALDQARKQRKVNSGDLVLLVAFGSGFVWASALVRMQIQSRLLLGLCYLPQLISLNLARSRLWQFIDKDNRSWILVRLCVCLNKGLKFLGQVFRCRLFVFEHHISSRFD